MLNLRSGLFNFLKPSNHQRNPILITKASVLPDSGGFVSVSVGLRAVEIQRRLSSLLFRV